MNTNDTNIVLIGAGRMGQAIAYDLRHYDPHYPVFVIDNDADALDRLANIVGTEGLELVSGDISDEKLIRNLLKRTIPMAKSTVVIGAADYRLNYKLTMAAIENGASWVDLGGNNNVVARQFELDDAAKSAGVSVVPDCGLAPGMVNVLAGDARNRLDTMDELHFRVGGLPQFPKPPLFYGLVFSADGLANEYSEPCRIIENGEAFNVDPLTGWERIHVGPPYGTLEAFHTSGGSSTMTDTFEGIVQSLDYKTLRYQGHLKNIRLLLDLGLFDAGEIEISDTVSVAPRRLFGKILERPGWVEEDVVVMVGWAEGMRDNRNIKVKYRLFDEYDSETGLTAMARTTGFSAAVIARMIADERINERGALRQEVSVPPDQYIEEMQQRNVRIEIESV
ncbi:MAG: saccharopine dehydrogenase C-terminal domain-containing protein [Candidatus Electryoneaceae bacterium]|nr:saccharopine dehydrogenase C-terminal domain-containing protein [Candidatus Electryoneaceae bacterium]